MFAEESGKIEQAKESYPLADKVDQTHRGINQEQDMHLISTRYFTQ